MLDIHAFSSRPQVTYKKMDGTLFVPMMKITLLARSVGVQVLVLVS